jgi:hypothetical protein
MVIVTGTALPGVTDSGTSAFTCITPAVKPGASPPKFVGAGFVGRPASTAELA